MDLGGKRIGLRMEEDMTFVLSIVKEALIKGNVAFSNSTLQLGYILLHWLCILLVAGYQSGVTAEKHVAARESHVHIFVLHLCVPHLILTK